MWSQYIALALASILSLSHATSSFTPARPPAIPLAVRSPYVSAWQQAGTDSEANGPGNGGYLAGKWITFWTGQNLGWTGFIRVDGTSYTWMGNPVPLPTVVNQTAFGYTSTRSTFTMDIGGKISMNIIFLSPITPTDMTRQSLPFSYVDIEVYATDGFDHDVQVYTDITGEWASGDRSSILEWEYGVTPSDNIAYHKFYRQTQLLWSEIADQTEYGSWYWATNNAANLTFQSGSDVEVRSAFTNHGRLANTKDTTFRAIDDRWPTLAFAVDLGNVNATRVSTLFTLGLAQEQAIQFDGANGIVSLPSLWTSYFATELEALEYFNTDYATAGALATAFDDKVASDSNAAGGADYVILTALAARQAFGATQLCGTPDATYLFLKEISSDGNVQTVDVIFPFHPILIYANPELLRHLLQPLFINQEAGQWPNKYSIHDIGSHYPNATGHPDGNAEAQPLEECGNMLIMTLAYAQSGGNTPFLSQHYNILKQWTQYLVAEALIPADQISTDDFAGSLANQTNLALKGIIGIQAMSVIANLTGHAADAANYSSIAHDYIAQWQTLGIAMHANPPHTTLAYGMNDTHGLLYNLYSDRALGLGLVPQSVYDMQSTFYPTIMEEYGVPLDTRHDYTKIDWELFTAAVTTPDTTALFISRIAAFINQTPTNRALTDLYSASNADYAGGFTARPVVGGVFSLLALTRARVVGELGYGYGYGT